MARTTARSIDAYLAAQPAPARRVLALVRAILRKALPGATEGISYRIPILELDGAMVLYFAGFREHYSIYPATERLVAELGDAAAPLLHNRATLRFAYDAPVPARLIARIARLRAAEVAERRAAKKPAKKKPAAKRPAAKKLAAREPAARRPARRAR